MANSTKLKALMMSSQENKADMMKDKKMGIKENANESLEVAPKKKKKKLVKGPIASSTNKKLPWLK